MSYYEFSFEAPVEQLGIGVGKVLYYNVVILPDWCAAKLPFDTYPRLRIIGEVGDHPIRGAWNPVGDGRKYFILSSKFLKTAGLRLGDMTEVRFNIDDQEFVELPPELEAALEDDAALADIWNALTAGKQRFFCHRISSAKQQATRDRRLQAVVAELMA